jgi:predicted RNA-binding Zn-ribbon protein involved in translation (DUF1610 family)
MPGKDLLLYSEIPFCGLTFLMKCSSCRHENRVGASLAAACISCGAELAATARFCAECGHPVGPGIPNSDLIIGTKTTGKYLSRPVLHSRASFASLS